MIYKVDFGNTSNDALCGWTWNIHGRRAEQLKRRLRHDWFALSRCERRQLEKKARVEKLRMRLMGIRVPEVTLTWGTIADSTVQSVLKHMCILGLDPGDPFEVHPVRFSSGPKVKDRACFRIAEYAAEFQEL